MPSTSVRQTRQSSVDLILSHREWSNFETGGPGAPLPSKEPIGDEATDLAVAATGDRLVYTRRFVDSNIYRFEILDNGRRLGPPQKFIASTREEVSPEYSPDGRSKVFVSTRSGTQEIWLCNADGSNSRQLTSMGGPLTGNQSWSPDGQTVVFDSRKEGSSDLYLVGPQGGQAAGSHPVPDTKALPRGRAMESGSISSRIAVDVQKYAEYLQPAARLSKSRRMEQPTRPNPLTGDGSITQNRLQKSSLPSGGCQSTEDRRGRLKRGI